MKTQVQIYTQRFENHGDIDFPQWKLIGTHQFNLYVGSDLFLYNEEDCIEALKLMLFEESNDKTRYEYVSHVLAFHEPTQLHESIFLSKLQSVFQTNNAE
jgi:hypothetical protein